MIVFVFEHIQWRWARSDRRAPRLGRWPFSLLFPILEPGYAADRIVYATRRRQPQLCMPRLGCSQPPGAGAVLPARLSVSVGGGRGSPGRDRGAARVRWLRRGAGGQVLRAALPAAARAAAGPRRQPRRHQRLHAALHADALRRPAFSSHAWLLIKIPLISNTIKIV